MELMQLEMFVTVYEERGFKRAAEKVYRTQPAVSLAIAKLEKEIGSPLLVRRRGRREELHLTRTGELIYEYASRMIGLRNELLASLLPGKSRVGERLRLGISEGWTSRWLPQLIGKFRERRPHVSVGVWYERAELILREVRERRIDLALFDRVPGAVHRNMETMWIPASAHGTKSEQEQTLWLLRNRTGRSHASLEFEQEIRSLIGSQSEAVSVERGRRRALLREGRLVGTAMRGIKRTENLRA
jgi:DNA-binding transcriptional LysR family regulator